MKTGALIGLVFGLLWWWVGAGAVTGSAGTMLQILGIFIFAATGIWIVRRQDTPSRQKPRWNYYLIAVIAEVVAIMFSQAWLTARGLGYLLFPTVGLIVGLHFTGLWYAFARLRFLILATAMSAVNLLALLLPLSPGERLLLSGFGSSASLLITVLLP
ncbi:hypothetical protein [Pedobacter aquatilis]|uniref:hypothetical protein n=1 Tax=Pedobacter aquatilis TaxID=351343 RepID=UPI00292FEED9|nr:hypothetical protein [Pedobacter aquatilis]